MLRCLGPRLHEGIGSVKWWKSLAQLVWNREKCVNSWPDDPILLRCTKDPSSHSGIVQGLLHYPYWGQSNLMQTYGNFRDFLYTPVLCMGW